MGTGRGEAGAARDDGVGREWDYRRIVETAHEGVWVLDADDVTVFVNPRLAEMLGYTVDEMTGRSLYEFVSADDVARANDEFDRRRAGVSDQVEFCYRRKDGTAVFAQVAATPVFADDGRYAGTTAMLADVTDRVLVERELRRRLAQQAAVTALGRRALAGESVTALLGGAVDALTETLAADRSVALQLVGDRWEARAARGWEPAGGDPAVVAPAGLLDPEVRTGISVVIPVFGRTWGLLTAHTVSEREFDRDDVNFVQSVANTLASAIEREAQEAARVRQTEETERMLAALGDGLVLLDGHGCVVLGNAVGGKLLAEIGAGGTDGAPTFGGLTIHEVARRSTPGRGVDVPTVDGRRTVEVAVQPLDSRALDAGCIVVLRDVTEARAVQVRASRQDRLAAVGQVATGIAHDFNNVMSVITLYAESLLEGDDVPVRVRDQARAILQQAERGSSLVWSVLDFTHQRAVELVPLDLCAFVDELVAVIRRTLPASIDVTLRGPDHALHVSADVAQLQQLFLNLASNARDAMPRGGRLDIAVAPLAPGERPPGGIAGNWVAVTVADTGNGIAPDVLPHVFEPFFTTKPRGAGTGLGLAQVFRIVEQHGGHIDVRSAQGAGTTFTVWLPAVPAPAVASTSTTLSAPARAPRRTVLVVDDDAAVRAALADLVEAMGHETLTAADGEDALAVHARHAGQIALVISDVMMPGVGGIGLHRALRRRDPGLAVILTSGRPRHSLDAGDDVDVWLRKPFSRDQLATAVAAAIGGGG